MENTNFKTGLEKTAASSRWIIKAKNLGRKVGLETPNRARTYATGDTSMNKQAFLKGFASKFKNFLNDISRVAKASEKGSFTIQHELSDKAKDEIGKQLRKAQLAGAGTALGAGLGLGAGSALGKNLMNRDREDEQSGSRNHRSSIRYGGSEGYSSPGTL